MDPDRIVAQIRGNRGIVSVAAKAAVRHSLEVDAVPSARVDLDEAWTVVRLHQLEVRRPPAPAERVQHLEG
eukprot:1772214-Prymnesium_polylepis.1